MSGKKLPKLVLLGLCSSLFLSSFAFADDVIDVKNLPKQVTSTINSRYPKAKVMEARKTLEEKKDVYEVDLTNDKQKITIALFADGKIDWVALDMSVDELPKPVVTGIRKKYPTATLNDASKIFTVKDGKDHLEHFTVELTTKDGKKRVLDVLPNGMIETDEEDTE